MAHYTKEEEEKINNYKNFFKKHLSKVSLKDWTTKRLGKEIAKAKKYLNTRKKDGYYYLEEVKFWKGVDELIKEDFKSKLFSWYNVSNPLNRQVPIYPKANNIAEILLTGVKEYLNEEKIKNQIILDNANLKLERLEFIHNCLKDFGLHPLIKDRDPFYHKRYNIQIRIQNHFIYFEEYDFLLKHTAIKKIISAFLAERNLPFKDGFIAYHPELKFSVTSTLLKEDEIDLYLMQKGCGSIDFKNLLSFQQKQFFELFEREKDIMYDFPNFHPIKPQPKKKAEIPLSGITNIGQITNTNSSSMLDILNSMNAKPRKVVKYRRKPTNKNLGTYKALIIGVNDYQDKGIKNLDHPLTDAQKLQKVLETKYGFVDTIFLSNPTRNNLFDKLNELKKILKEGDNLLIFYAGHGHWEEDIDLGYWLLNDAEKDNDKNWISSSAIIDYLKKFKKCQHILLISDSCFSGTLLKTRRVITEVANEELYQSKSRKVISSGAKDEEVPDKSEFFKQLLAVLTLNKEKSISTKTLFHKIHDNVIGKTRRIPLYGIIDIIDINKGDFIFYLK